MKFFLLHRRNQFHPSAWHFLCQFHSCFQICQWKLLIHLPRSRSVYRGYKLENHYRHKIKKKKKNNNKIPSKKIWINISVRHQKNTCSFRYDITDNTCTLNFVKSCAGCAFLDIESICKRSQWPLHGGPDAVYTKKKYIAWNIILAMFYYNYHEIIRIKM